MTTEELRRLAEQERERATPGHLNVSAVAILSLLDERDARESAANYYRDLAAERAHLQGLAEQRVVALEAQLDASMEGLRDLEEEAHRDTTSARWREGAAWALAEARQLLQASAQDASEGSGK